MYERDRDKQKIEPVQCALNSSANVIGVKRKYANIINGLVLRLEILMFQMHSHEFRAMNWFGWNGGGDGEHLS